MKKLIHHLSIAIFLLFYSYSSFAIDYFHYFGSPTGSFPESPHTGEILSLAVSPDGTKILTGSADNTAKLWDINTRQVIHTFQADSFEKNSFFNNKVVSVAFSPDGEKILTAHYGILEYDTTNTPNFFYNVIRIWDVSSGQLLLKLQGHKDRIRYAAFSPDGTKVITIPEGNYEKTAKLWDAETGKEIFTMDGDTKGINVAAFSPDGTKFLTGNADRSVTLWDISTGQVIRTVTDGIPMISYVGFSPDGQKIIVSGQQPNNLKIIDLSTGQVNLNIDKFDNPGSYVKSVAFLPEGKNRFITKNGNSFSVWDLDSGQLLHTFSAQGYSNGTVLYTNDGTKIITAFLNTFTIWDANDYSEIKTIGGHSGYINSIACSPNGLQVLSGAKDGTAILWNAQTHHEILRFKGHQSEIFSVKFSPDGQKALTASADNTSKIWDLNTGNEILTFIGHTASVNTASFSKDGKMIVTGSDDKTIKIWDAVSGAEIRTITGHTKPIYYAIFSPDGNTVFSGSEDNTARLWNVNTGFIIYKITDAAGAAFSPDGSIIYVNLNNYKANLLDAKTGKVIRSFKYNFNTNGRNISFSSDGSKVFDCLYNYLIDINSGQPIRTLFTTVEKHITCADFSPDDTQLLCGTFFSQENTQSIQTYDLTMEQPSKIFSLEGNQIITAVFLADGIHVLFGDQRIDSGKANLINLNTGKIENAFVGQNPRSPIDTFSPDGKELVIVGNMITLWNVESSKIINEVTNSIDYLNTAASINFSPDGNKIIIGYRNQTVEIWDKNKWIPLISFPTHSESIYCVGFTSDGSMAVTTDNAGTIKLWDASTGDELKSIKITNQLNSSFSVSPDSTKIASYGFPSKGAIVEILSGRTIFQYPISSSELSPYPVSIHFLTNSIIAISISQGSNLSTVDLFDLITNQQIHTFQGEFFAVSPDKKTLLTHNGQDVIVWDIHEYLQTSDPVTGIQDWCIF